jgi:hypothetical protein
MKLLLWIVAGLMAVGGSCPAQGDAPSHADSFSKEGLIKADVSELKDTELVAHPDTPLDPTKNVLWCGTLQLAWNEAIGLAGEKLIFDNPPPVVGLLNREDFTRADLDPASYVAIADFERNHVENQIRAALEKTFGDAASPELIPPIPTNPAPDDFVAYAYLYKNLSFAHPFPDNDPLYFGEMNVKNFGFVRDVGELSGDVLKQVQIYDYQSRNDFVIQLKTKSPREELILAKVTPGATLQATIDAVLQRIATNKPETAAKSDRMAIPKLNFDLRKDFHELEGLVLEPSPAAKIRSKLVLTKAEQLVRFQLNEKGAVLKSEAVMVMKALAMVPGKMLIFDRPFLVLMKQADSPKPYFALWVGNASLLEPAQ